MSRYLIVILLSAWSISLRAQVAEKLQQLGMENIQRCAKKYRGDIDMTIRDVGDKKRFNLTIMMYKKYFTPQIS